MKKYLMTGIAALAICAAFTSCSKDIDLYDQATVDANEVNQIYEAYNKAFIATFGQPAANQDWGFSNKATRALGDYKTKGSMTTSFTFPSDCDASKFTPNLDGVKSYKEVADAANQGGGFATGVCYIDENHTGKVHIWGQWGGDRAILYFKAGTYDFTNETFDLCADADLYLLEGATLTLNNTAASTAKFDVYIAKGAELIANGQDGFRADVDAHVYNHGKITCSRFEVNGTSFLYNVGELKSSGDVYIANSTSRIVNDGDVQSASVHVEGSGGLQNNAEWTVTRNTIVNCTDGGWINNGHWITQNYGYTAGSENVINNCFLEVTKDFDMNISSSNSNAAFKIDTGGGVLTQNFNGGKVITDASSVSGPYKIVMGHSAVFKVTGTATLEGGNPGWGFFGPTDGAYAVFQAKNVVRNEGIKNTQGAVTYSGNLYVSAETHFAQGHDGMDAEGHYFINEWNGFSVNTNIYAAGFQPGKPSVTIPTTNCCPGFDGGGDDPADIRIIAEDLNAKAIDAAAAKDGLVDSDWDFNDVVFDVKFIDETSADVKIVCAGGVLPLYVDGHEVHEALGHPEKDANGLYRIIGMSDACTPFRVSGISKSNNGKDIKVEVKRTLSSGTEVLLELRADTGLPAAKIAVKPKFTPCGERQDIRTVYPNFASWVQNQVDTWYPEN